MDEKHSFIFQTQKEKTDWIRHQFTVSLLDIQPQKMGLNSLILKQDKCYIVVMWFLLRTSLKVTLLVVLEKVVSFSLTIYSSIHIMILRTLSLHMRMLKFLFMKKLHYFYKTEGHVADSVHLQVIGGTLLKMHLINHRCWWAKSNSWSIKWIKIKPMARSNSNWIQINATKLNIGFG